MQFPRVQEVAILLQVQFPEVLVAAIVLQVQKAANQELPQVEDQDAGKRVIKTKLWNFKTRTF